MKNRAMKEHKDLFLWTARTLEGYHRLAGEEEHADRIRPCGRRPGRRLVDVNDETSEGASPEESPEQSAPESSAPGTSADSASDSSASDSSGQCHRRSRKRRLVALATSNREARF